MIEPAAPSTSPSGAARWHLRLLGGFELDDGQHRITRLPSRAVVALLARLALAPQRSHPREELIELLWPGVALDAGRNRLRQALSTLRATLEPTGQPNPHPVLDADRLALRLRPGAMHCDVPAFELAVANGHDSAAHAWYRGELLPGLFDDWIAQERLRLEAVYDRLAARGQPPSAASVSSSESIRVSIRVSTSVSTSVLARQRLALVAARLAPPQPGVPVATPAPSGPSPAERPRPSLPRYLTHLLGAQQRCQELAQTVSQQRLVTLLGPGGSGKTRLAVEAAAQLDEGTARLEQRTPAFDLVRFVPLVGCSDADGLTDALLLALNQRARAADPLRQVLALLAGRRSLLVLDNFEQLVDSGAALLAQLLSENEALHLLVTSRRVLGLDGEVQMLLPPLPLPEADAPLALAAANPAVALFADRARAARTDFHLNPRNLGAVVALVRLLEGMPLAIELAAARVRSLPPQALVALLRDAVVNPSQSALELLSRSGPRGAGDPRHASMLRVIDWSWKLLSTDARQLLMRLAVCSGSFGLGAACALNQRNATRTAQALDTLVAHSLLRVEAATDDADGSAPRWSLYELIREHAVLQLSAADAAQHRQRLRRWLSDWARKLPLTAPLPEVRAELPLIAAAIGSALPEQASEDAADLALALQSAFSDMALPSGLLGALAQAVQQLASRTRQALLHTLLARAWHRAGEAAATEHHFAAAWAAMPNSGVERAQVLARLAHIRWRTRRDASVSAWLDEAWALAQAAGEPSLQASVLSTQGALARARGSAAAVALQRRALALWTQAGDGAGQLTGQYNLSLALNQRQATRAEALDLITEMIARARAAQDWGQLANGHIQRGEILCALRRWSEAGAAYREALRLSFTTLDPLPLAYALWNLPRVLAHQRQPQLAERLMAFASRFWVQRFGPLNRADLHDVRRLRRLVQVQTCGSAPAQAATHDVDLALGDAVRLALSTQPGMP